MTIREMLAAESKKDDALNIRGSLENDRTLKSPTAIKEIPF